MSLSSPVESSSAAGWRERIAAAKSGNRAAQNELFAALRPLLLSLANQRIGGAMQHAAAPSDVVQEALVRAWDGLGDFRGRTRGELVAWLKTILQRRIADEARRTARADRAAEKAPQRFPRATGPEALTAGGPTASRGLMVDEEKQRIEQALGELPQRYEQAIRLRNELELTYREIGVALGCSEEAARKLWARAIERLGSLLNEGARSSRPAEA